MEKVKNLKLRYNYSLILLRELVITDFKLRYQGSALGYLWSLLRPLAIFAVLYFVFVVFLRVGEGIPHFAIYLLLGIVLWNFFVEITLGSVGAIVGKGDLIRKINFPKYVIILATSFSALINLFLNFIVIVAFMIIFGASPSWSALIVVPLLIIELYFLGLAFAFFLSTAFVKYRDVSYIWEVLIQAAFYATPILYPLALIPVAAQKFSMLNPMAQIIQDARFVLVTPQTLTGANTFSNMFFRLIPILLVFIAFVIGALYFKKNSKSFAEDV
jgi:ABC-2 type transport system permease protein